MKSYIRLAVVSFWLLCQGGIVSSMETIDNRAQETILNLLSLKFSYEGQALADKIEETKEEEAFKNLRQKEVDEVLENLKFTNNQTSKQRVTVYLPQNSAEGDYQSYLIAAAYYPREFDPQRLLFTQICDLEHIHLQLAYALHYGHPLAASNLEVIADSYGLPQNHELYDLIKQKERVKENLVSYIISINKPYTPYNHTDELDLDSKNKDEKIEHFKILTIFQDRKKPLLQWFHAAWHLTENKHGTSARSL